MHQFSKTLQFENTYEVYIEYLFFHKEIVDINNYYKDNFSKGMYNDCRLSEKQKGIVPLMSNMHA